MIYDIPDDKLRYKVAEACKDYGLERIQWSAFSGKINHNKREEMFLRFKKILSREMGNIQIFPLCDKDLRLKMEIINNTAVAEEE